MAWSDLLRSRTGMAVAEETIMKFFFPLADDEQTAEIIYRNVVSRFVERTGITISRRRVFALRYRLRDSEYLAQVGIPHPPGEAEDVVCILESGVGYFICTRARGVVYGEPLAIPRGLVSDVEHFNDICDEIH